MKTLLFLLLSLVLSITNLLAQGGPPAHAGRHANQAAAPTQTSDELAALEQFLAMDNEQLDQMQQAIARVRSLTPAERTALRARIADYRRLPADQRERVRAGWGWQNDQDRTDWPRMMHSKTDAERAALQAAIQALQPEQRATHKHALLEAWRSGQADKP